MALRSRTRLRCRIEFANNGDVGFERRTIWVDAAPYALRLHRVPSKPAGCFDMLGRFCLPSKEHTKKGFEELIEPMCWIEVDALISGSVRFRQAPKVAVRAGLPRFYRPHQMCAGHQTRSRKIRMAFGSLPERMLTITTSFGSMAPPFDTRA